MSHRQPHAPPPAPSRQRHAHAYAHASSSDPHAYTHEASGYIEEESEDYEGHEQDLGGPTDELEAEGEETEPEPEDEGDSGEDGMSDTSSADYDPIADPEGFTRRLDELAGSREVGVREERAVRGGPVLGLFPGEREKRSMSDVLLSLEICCNMTNNEAVHCISADV